MRVLTVVHSLGIGGVEVTLLRSLPTLRRLGVEIGVACPGEPGALSDSFVAEGATIHRLPRGANRMLGALPIRELVERFEYHLVHSRLGYNAGSHVIGAQLAGRPCLVSFHNSRPTLQELGISRRSLKAAALRPWLAINSHIILKHARLVIGHSEANLDQFYPDWRRRPDLFRVLTNGIEFPRIEGTKTDNRTFLGLPADVPVFLHVGSFKRQKNHSELLQIFREIRKHEPRSILVLVGDSSRRVVIEAEASRMGLDDFVVFAGHRRDTERFFAAADVFLFPSFSEGYGNVLIEAQAAGLPVVASDIPAHREAVASPQHQFLYRLGDIKSAAELALRQLAMARSRSNPWVEQSKSIVSIRNSIETMAGGLADIYRGVLFGDQHAFRPSDS